MNIDTIVRDVLLEHNFTLHRYAYFAGYAERAYRELTLDVLYTRMPLEIDLVGSGTGIAKAEGHAYDLPNDYVDLIRIGRFIDGMFVPMPEERKVAGMVLRPAERQVPPYHGSWDDDVAEYAIIGKVLYLHPAISGLYNVYLEYMPSSDTIRVDTPIHPYLAPTIAAYIKWKAKLGDASAWYNEVRTLKARLSKTTANDVARSFSLRKK